MQFDLVFEGGGAKGAVFVGALQEFEARGYLPCRLVGTSAGAITAALVAAGASADWLHAALCERDAAGKSVFASFADVASAFEPADVQKSAIAEMLERIDLPLVPNRWESALDQALFEGLLRFRGFRMLFSMLEKGGVYEGGAFVAWMTSKLNALDARGPAREGPGLGAATLRRFHEEVGADLSILASDVDAQELLVFNHRTAPDLPVAWAVRMSMSIPMVWQEVNWREEWGLYRGRNITGHTIVDGGVLSNFPIDLITSGLAEVAEIMGDTDPMAVPNLGFLIDEDLPVPGVPTKPEEPGVVESIAHSRVVLQIAKLMDTMMNARDRLVIERCMKSHEICRLPARGYTATEFEMSAERMVALVSAGRAAAFAYFEERAAFEGGKG